MNRKEVNELRRRLRPDKNNIERIYGCYVNSNREVVSYIEESMGLLGQEEAEKYLSLLKKTLSGSLGRNLMELSFATKQVADSDEVRLLSALRRTKLGDASLREELYRGIIGSVEMGEGGCLILLAHDAYDVPRFGKDGNADEENSEVFRYLLCCVCPVKAGKVQFGYEPEEKRFRNFPAGQVAAMPELGFLYPCFDGRAANIYNALLYSRNTAEDHRAFIDSVFRTEVPMPAETQLETFRSVVCETLEKDCNFELMQGLHGQLNERIMLHKESKDPEPLVMTPEEMGDLLEDCGADPEKVEHFEEKIREQMGKTALLSPANLIGSPALLLNTSEIRIQVPAALSHLVQEKMVDGHRCIVINADSGVEINGVNIRA